MDQMKISEFKSRCISVLARVGKTGEPLLVTRFGKPVAQIFPPPPDANPDWMGSMRGSGEILGDIISPVAAPEDWEALR